MGQMVVGDNRRGEFTGVTPLKEFRIIVTAEDLPAAGTPSSQVVLSTDVFKVP